jgi:hypothetical protein
MDENGGVNDFTYFALRQGQLYVEKLFNGFA